MLAFVCLCITVVLTRMFRNIGANTIFMIFFYAMATETGKKGFSTISYFYLVFIAFHHILCSIRSSEIFREDMKI